MTFDTVDIDRLNGASTGLVKHLGIEFMPSSADTLMARMPVDERTVQPLGLLHGGATAALAETLGSIGSHMSIDSSTHSAVGMEVTAQHIRSATEGHVIGTARLQHKGRTVHVWEILVHDESERLLAICKLSVMIIPKRS